MSHVTDNKNTVKKNILYPSFFSIRFYLTYNVAFYGLKNHLYYKYVLILHPCMLFYNTFIYFMLCNIIYKIKKLRKNYMYGCR